MIAIEDAVLVLLAAGRSARFGNTGSKLDADLWGRPLGLHIAVALAELPFRERVAVVGESRLDYGRHGFRVLLNGHADEGMASSVRLGVRSAQDMGARAVMLALADMPRVTASLARRLFNAAEGSACVVASSDGKRSMPPVIVGRDRFDQLREVRGDRGARDLIATGRQVVVDPAELVDVDTAEELEQLRRAGCPDRVPRLPSLR